MLKVIVGDLSQQCAIPSSNRHGIFGMKEGPRTEGTRISLKIGLQCLRAIHVFCFHKGNPVNEVSDERTQTQAEC
ncbi:unnamed protein product [Lactuca virosa]|uniref:Uncharacterized protein n=1 Tax=Lactuca virosa TaxID=75947 RepID=A0AAU9LUV0_9ASTR|nr:unnamed protein product [Lactuca virosa]